MNRLFLIGYMGAGKTTAGKELARMLNLDFIDLDLYIESRHHKSINKIFAEFGEAKFREIEQNVLKEVSEFENTIISTGGGTPCFLNNMQHMNEKGKTIYLKTDPLILANRLSINKDKRPLLKDKNKDELLIFVKDNLAKRESFYSLAQLTYNTDNFTDKDIHTFVSDMINDLKLDIL